MVYEPQEAIAGGHIIGGMRWVAKNWREFWGLSGMQSGRRGAVGDTVAFFNRAAAWLAWLVC